MSGRVARGPAGRVLVTGATVGVVLVVVAAGLNLRASLRRDSFLEAGEQAAPVRVRDLGELPEPIRESSGAAASRAYPGIVWTHNDSGDRPRLYAIDTTAALVSTFEIAGVDARDWEALDIGPCPAVAADSAWCLYVGDTGDNGRRRESVTVHVVREPDPRAEAADSPAGGVGMYAVHEIDPVARVRFRYRDGPFDAEALAVTPAGDVVVVTKGRAPTVWLFRMPADTVARYARTGEVALLTDRVRVPIEPEFQLGRWITGGSIDGTGSVLALRTYTEVYFYRWPIEAEPEAAAETCFLGLLEPNGEAVAFTADRRLLLTSESPGRLHGHLLEVECTGVAPTTGG